MSANVDKSFWKNKKVFLTGHTGFKGSWISLWLQNMGAKVKGYSLNPPTKPSMYELADVSIGMESNVGDIRDLNALVQSMTSFNPDILIHMAAQPLVRHSYLDPIETYSTNVMGTVNVFEAARKCQNLRAIVNVTTDKCYENMEWEWGYRENERLGGYDPYSNSKGCAELVTSAYRKSFFSTGTKISIATARAGNVIGGGDWAEDRLIPDILRAFEKKIPVIVRNPNATRPWQHVLEPLKGYLLLAEKLYNNGDEYSEPWNFGPPDEDVKPVEWIINNMCKKWQDDVFWKLENSKQPHEARLLKLDASKANQRLDWQPKWALDEALNYIIEWHQSWIDNRNLREVTIKQIEEYIK